MESQFSNEVNEELAGPQVDANHCGIHFNLDIVDYTLEVSWQFSQLKLNQRYYSRHVLVIRPQQRHQLDVLAEAYYRQLPLGSFFKVFDVSSGLNYGWFEKTSSKLSLKQCQSELVQKKVASSQELQQNAVISKEVARNFKIALMNCLKDSSRNAQFMEVTIVLSTDQQTFEHIHQFAQKFQGHLSVFVHENVLMPNSLKQLKFCTVKSFTTPESVKSLFQELFCQLTKFRAKKLEIEIEFIDTSVSVREHKDSRWKVVDGRLRRQLHCLNNYTQYVEKLNLVNFKQSRTYCQMTFRVVKLDGEQFVAEGQFVLNLEGNCQKSAMQPRTNLNNKVLKVSHRSLRNSKSAIHEHQEQVMMNYF